MDALGTLQGIEKPQQVFDIAPAAAVAPHGDAGLAAGKNQQRLLESVLGGERHSPLGAAQLARFALQVVAEQAHLNAVVFGGGLPGRQGVPGAGKDLARVPGKAGIAAPGRDVPTFQAVTNVLRHLDGVTLENRQGIVGRRGVRQGRARGHQRGFVAGHVGDQPGQHPRRMRGGPQTPTLDGGEMATHGVDLTYRRAAAQQRLIDGLLLGERDPRRRQRHQRRAAAGDQRNHQVILSQVRHSREHPPRRLLAQVIGHRMRGLEDLDAPALAILALETLPLYTMAVTRHHQAFEWRIGLLDLPGTLQGRGHGGGGLARADHHGAPERRLREPVGQQGIRMHGGDRGIGQLPEPGPRRLDRATRDLGAEYVHDILLHGKKPGDGRVLQGEPTTGQGSPGAIRQATTRRLPSGSSHLPVVRRLGRASEQSSRPVDGRVMTQSWPISWLARDSRARTIPA